MNWDQIYGHWHVYNSFLREKWGKITDSDYEVIAGKKDRMIGKIQEQYGIGKEEAEKELDKFIVKLEKKD